MTLRPGSVKICSLREVDHARSVLNAGANHFGLIFVSGRRRQVTVDRARAIVRAVRDGTSDCSPMAVGVFVDSPASEINAVARIVGLDIVQLHGEEPPELLESIELPAIKAIGVQTGDSIDAIRAKIEAYASVSTPPIAFLIDGVQGGTGTMADWSIAAEIAQGWPVMLAGGLTPENVANAIATVSPLGVDVSSGVESDGVKDAAKIAAFTANARAAFATGVH